MLSDEAMNVYDKTNNMKEALLLEAELSDKDHRWCTFLHLAPLSTVTEQRIRSVYPNKNRPIIVVYNTVVEPREKETFNVACICGQYLETRMIKGIIFN